MAHVKTAVSLDEQLFAEAKQVASEMDVSRSRLFSLAVEEFIRRYRNRQLLAELNEVYSEDAASDEQAYLQGMKRFHREVVEEEAW